MCEQVSASAFDVVPIVVKPKPEAEAEAAIMHRHYEHAGSDRGSTKRKEASSNARGRKLHEKWTRLVEMAMRGWTNALKTIWQCEGTTFGGIDARVPEWMGVRSGKLLQIAVHAG
ncbi:hypothetical protein A0H81_12058 [Grifola frondosa]|uniref:Uncharacterized protein n=1 Tax=Grifola frondosa TaxID=5627 RepID=A0A1C7LUR2_GRIFR|nr:hypothetical protein A0H81_12058 [Grifola frondosa]